MNADLEMTLDEMGPAYRAVVGRLRAGREIEPVRREGRGVLFCAFWRSTRVTSLLAASLLAALVLSVWLARPRAATAPAAASFGGREYRLSVREMIATQRADGSWQNDFLTRRNAEFLGRLDDPAARIASKRALRNLRVRGIL